MGRDLPGVEKSQLFERLGEGHGAATTVVTPNRRLAQSLAREFAARQASRGLAAWETADILPFESWLRRLWDEAIQGEGDGALPLLLSPAQELAAWEEAIRASRFGKELFALGPAVSQCREAWHLAHAWRIPLDARRIPNDDGRAFLEWASHYERVLRERGHGDPARAADLLAPLLAGARLRKPATLAMAGFDIVAPQQRDFLERIADGGATVVEVTLGSRAARLVSRVALADAAAEVDAAARWARTRLEAAQGSSPRIGIVVPDLARSRSRIERALADVLAPGHRIAAAEPVLPFNVSLGLPLDSYPLVADALYVIDLAGAHAPFEHASRVLRSPFIAGAEAEREARARLDARLRRRAMPELSLDSFVRQGEALGTAPDFVGRFRRLAEFRKSDLFEARTASGWARAFSDALRIVGFPGERTPGSREQQALAKWHEVLAQFATLEQVSGKMGFQLARERLRRMAREEIFQPKAPEVPIQVMGILESAGQEFDHLWVMGLTDDAWPLPARPNPFIPVAAQRAAGIAQADPAASLELDRRITRGWMQAAPEVVVSHATMHKESELAPSPLIAMLPSQTPEALGVRPFATLHQAMRAASAIETIQDGTAPPIAGATGRGGTGLFKDQAACPFRAFAKRRLLAEEVETPHTGLDARDRGNLLHEMLKALWDRVVTQERLAAMSPGDVETLLGECAEQALTALKRRRAETLSGRYGELERERLVRLARAWLEVERGRPVPFKVLKTEEECEVEFGGVRVKGRLDRRDELEGGRIAVIDYKSGECKTSAWAGPRLDEPQLPMYALGGPDAGRVSVVTFAQVRTAGSRFRGLSDARDLVTGVTTVDKDRSQSVKEYGSWDRLVAHWRTQLEGLGRAYAAGDARVDPKNLRVTCKLCEQHALCRVAEKAPFGAAAGDEEGEADD